MAPLVAGHLADRWLDSEWILSGAPPGGRAAPGRRPYAAVLAAVPGHAPVFVLLCGHTAAGELPDVRPIGKTLAAGEIETWSGKIFILGPGGLGPERLCRLAAWRGLFKTQAEGRDCLYLAAVLSAVMGATCLYLPATPPAATGEMPIVKALMWADHNFFIFLAISLVIAGLMQFYFLGTGRFLQDLGVPGQNISAAMALAQVVQALATLFLLGLCITRLGYRNTLIVGAAAWLVMYALYVVGRPRMLIMPPRRSTAWPTCCSSSRDRSTRTALPRRASALRSRPWSLPRPPSYWARNPTSTWPTAVFAYAGYMPKRRIDCSSLCFVRPCASCLCCVRQCLPALTEDAMFDAPFGSLGIANERPYTDVRNVYFARGSHVRSEHEDSPQYVIVFKDGFRWSTDNGAGRNLLEEQVAMVRYVAQQSRQRIINLKFVEDIPP